MFAITQAEQQIKELKRMWNLSNNGLKQKEIQNKNPMELKKVVENRLNEIVKILDEIIPVYAELLDKDNLTPQEEWVLRALKDSFYSLKDLLFLTSAYISHIAPALSINEREELVEKWIALSNFLREITGEFEEGYNAEGLLE